MIIDAHAHLEPRLLKLKNLVAKMDQAGIDRTVLLPTLCDPIPATPDILLATIRRLMNNRLGRPLTWILHRAMLTPEGDLKLGGKIYQIYAQPDNESVARAISQYPKRFWGWIFLNPRNNPNALEELEHWRSRPGMIGVKFHPHWHDYRTRILDPLLARLQDLGLPVMFHLGFGDRGDYRAMAKNFPGLKMIFAHAGFPYYKQIWPFVKKHPNLYMDLSSPYLDEALVQSAVKAVGPEKCIYGTDSPFGFHEADGTYDYHRIKGWIERLPIRKDQTEAIFSGNLLDLVPGHIK